MPVPAGAAAVAPTSTPIGARIPFAQTNGDILAITKVAGASRDLIAFGGNFSAVITPDGVSRPAKDFAVVDEDTGALVYAGNVSSYVRTITSRDGVIYVGGDFTTFGGVARNRLAALSPTFAVTSWNPSPGFRIYAALAGPLGVYYGGDGGTRGWPTSRRARRSGRSPSRVDRSGRSGSRRTTPRSMSVACSRCTAASPSTG